MNERVLFFRGNILVDAVFSRLNAMSAAELRTLASALPRKRSQTCAAPPQSRIGARSSVAASRAVASGAVSGDEWTGPTPLALEAPHAGYVLRTWQPGDRMRPARLKGRSRKLSDLYIDAKVPRAARLVARVLVRTSDATIVWAEHVGLAFGESRSITPLPPRSDGKF